MRRQASSPTTHRAWFFLVALAACWGLCLLLPLATPAQRPQMGLDVASKPVDATWVGVRPSDSSAPFIKVADHCPLHLSLPLAGLRDGARCDIKAERRGWLFSYEGEVTGIQLGGLGAQAYVVVDMQAHLSPVVPGFVVLILVGGGGLAWRQARRGKNLEQALHQVRREKQIMAETKSRDSDLPPLIGQTLETDRGRIFEILRLVGYGSMGAVFEAVPREGGGRREETWAVKVPFRATLEDPESRRRFLREAELCRQLRHPGVIEVLDWGWYHAGPREDERGWPFIVMEMMTGETLRDLLEKRRREGLPVAQVIGWLQDLVQAVGAMHRSGIVHRDLKPENVFISKDGQPKIGDFGVAGRLDRHTMTVAGDALGTPLYMSPEHLEAASTTPQSDIYSLGVIAYELLVGHPPFEADNVFTVLNRMLSEAAPPISRTRPDVPPALERLVMSMMEKEAARRPSAERILQILKSISAPPRPREHA